MSNEIIIINFSKFKTTEATQEALNKVLPRGIEIEEAKSILRANKVMCKDEFKTTHDGFKYIECAIQYPINTTGKVNYFIALRPFNDADKNHLLQQADVTRHTTYL